MATRRLLLSVLTIMLPLVTSAVEINGINYELNNTNLTATVVRNYMEYYDEEDDEYYLYPAYSGDIVIPGSVQYNGTVYSVTSIESGAFKEGDGEEWEWGHITSVTIPSSVTSIGEEAFENCYMLVNVKVCVLDMSSFCNNKTIGQILVQTGKPIMLIDSDGAEIKDYVIPNDVTTIGESAFYRCSGLTSVTIPNSVTAIGGGAFSGCRGLTSVTIPNSVKSIGDYAFSGCNGLTSVTIPNSVTSIGEGAFGFCSSLTSVTIGNSVTSIDSWAFFGCSRLSSVTIPNSVTYIGDYAFEGCSGLTSVTIPNNVTSIGESAFQDCSGLTSVTIGNSVTFIGYKAFSGCSGLTTVNITDLKAWLNISFGDSDANPLYYAYHLFLNGKEVKELVIPNSVTSIGNYAFYNCSSLTSVSIPNSVTSIGRNAFWNCTGLTSVSISKSVKSIGEAAFFGCTSLTSVTVNWLRPVDISTNTFSNMENATLYVPVPCWPVYMATNWGYFKEVVEISDTTHTLTYMVDDEVYKTYELQEGAVITPEIEPTKEGYTFSGWSEIPATMPAEDVLIFGYFEKIGYISETTYTLTYMVDDEVYKTYEMQEGGVITPETEPIMEGYIFSGWSEIPGTMPSHDVTVYGYFEFDTNTTDAILCDNLQCISGSAPILKVGLTNTNEVKLCQFDLQLPAGVTVATKSNGKLEAKLTERAENHSVSSKQLENGNYRFVISSLDNDSFTGNSGTLIEITLDIPLNIETGEYIVKVINAELSVPDGNDLKVVKPADTESKLTVSNYTPGDVNNDGSVSVTDVGCAINYILEQIPSVFVFEAADMNADNTVSVTDVGMIINLILSDGASSRRRAPERNNSDNGLLPQINLQPTAEGYELRLENKDAYIGFQFDMELSDNAVISGIQLNGPANDDHLLTYRRLSNGKWRVVCYSPTNSSFYNDDSALLTITASNSISVSDICLTTSGLNELHPSNLFGMPTGIANVEKTNSKTTLNLYSLSGNIYRILNLRSGVNSFDGLRPGIYLIDNKKIIIR